MKKLTTEEFIQRAKEVHGEKYDYSNTNLINTLTKVNIICPVHGEFIQNPRSFLKGFGCYKCSDKSTHKSNTEEFIQKAREVHGEKYDYSKVNYVNSSTKMNIICSIHGEFEQKPNNHLTLKQGCPKCSGNYMTTEYFIQKAKEIHGNKFDYTNTIYINQKTKVTIICPVHGEFEQKADSHLAGKGCAKCYGRGLKWISLEELRKIINPLKLKSHDEYLIWYDQNRIYCQKMGIPKYPDQHYK